MICRTDAVVLRTMKFRDTSLIATVLTPDFGKVSLLAKGARAPRSKMGSVLQPMNRLTVVFYHRESRDLQLVTQADVSVGHRRLGTDLASMAAGMAVIELTDAVVKGVEENRPLFALVERTLGAIDAATKPPAGAFYHFEIRLMGLLGFRPEFARCTRCGLPLDASAGEEGTTLLETQSGVLCPACSAGGIGFEEISLQAVRALRFLQEAGEPERALNLVLQPRVDAEVRSALRRFLQRHVEGVGVLKSERVFSFIQ
jgi:DNA repair protein RecO (recombination protein O)